MHWFSSLLDTLNYWTIFLGMYIEGTVIPFPSELIVSPAAYHAAAGHLNVFWVVIVATLGAMKTKRKLPRCISTTTGL